MLGGVFGPTPTAFGSSMLGGQIGVQGGTEALLPSAASLEPPMQAPTWLHLAAIAILFVPAFAMLLRRSWPFAVFLLVFCCFVVTAVLGVPSLAPGIALSIAAYALAYRVSRRFALAYRVSRRFAFAVCASAAVLILLLAFAVTEWESLDPRVFQIVAAVLIAASLGDSARSRREYLAAVTERAERAEQTREAEAQRRVAEERLRIARDLHDTVAHRIAVISLNAGVASGALDTNPQRADEALGTIRRASRTVLGEIGELLHYLRSEAPGGEAPQPGLSQLGSLLRGVASAGLTVETSWAGEGEAQAAPGQPSEPTVWPSLGEAVDLVAYRVVQEGLTNPNMPGGTTTALGASSLPGSSTGSSSPSGTGSTTITAEQLLADQAAINLAEAELKIAQAQLAFSKLTSPVDGEVLAVTLAAGDTVTAGSDSATVVVAGDDDYVVETTVSLTNIAKIAIGQSVTATITATGESYAGTISSRARSRSSSALSAQNAARCARGSNRANRPKHDKLEKLSRGVSSVG